MSKKRNTPTEERQAQEQETSEMLLAEDAVQTTVYLANAPDCCSGEDQCRRLRRVRPSAVADDEG